MACSRANFAFYLEVIILGKKVAKVRHFGKTPTNQNSMHEEI